MRATVIRAARLFGPVIVVQFLTGIGAVIRCYATRSRPAGRAEGARLAFRARVFDPFKADLRMVLTFALDFVFLTATGSGATANASPHSSARSSAEKKSVPKFISASSASVISSAACAS